MNLFKDGAGKYCMAKMMFFMSVCTFLGVIIQNPANADYQGMSMFLGAVGAVYFGRSHTKESSNA